MIVLKHNGTVYIAKSHFTLRECLPEPWREKDISEERIGIWHPNGETHRLIAVRDPGRFSDRLCYEEAFPASLDAHDLLRAWSRMCELCEREGIGDGSALPDAVVFAEDGCAVYVTEDGSRMEVEGAYGSRGTEQIVMALYEMWDKRDPEELMRDAFRILENRMGLVMLPAVMMDTRTDKIRMIGR